MGITEVFDRYQNCYWRYYDDELLDLTQGRLNFYYLLQYSCYKFFKCSKLWIALKPPHKYISYWLYCVLLLTRIKLKLVLSFSDWLDRCNRQSAFFWAGKPKHLKFRNLINLVNCVHILDYKHNGFCACVVYKWSSFSSIWKMFELILLEFYLLKLLSHDLNELSIYLG